MSAPTLEKGIASSRILALPMIPVRRPDATCLFECSIKPRQLSVIGGRADGNSMPMHELRLLEALLAWLSCTEQPFTSTLCTSWRASFLLDPNNVALIYHLFQRYSTVIKKLRIALDEEDVVRHEPTLLPVLRRLSEDGVGLLLDNFGGGISSIALYREGIFSAVRLPPRWSACAGQDPSDDVITRGLINLAFDLGMRTVADNPSNEKSLETLLNMGIDYVQGVNLAQAVPLTTLSPPPTKSAWDYVTDHNMLETLSRAYQASQNTQRSNRYQQETPTLASK